MQRGMCRRHGSIQSGVAHLWVWAEKYLPDRNEPKWECIENLEYFRASGIIISVIVNFFHWHYKQWDLSCSFLDQQHPFRGGGKAKDPPKKNPGARAHFFAIQTSVTSVLYRPESPRLTPIPLQVKVLFPSARNLKVTWSNVVKLGQSLYREVCGRQGFPFLVLHPVSRSSRRSSALGFPPVGVWVWRGPALLHLALPGLHPPITGGGDPPPWLSRPPS